jgi:hypothetical protein
MNWGYSGRRLESRNRWALSSSDEWTEENPVRINVVPTDIRSESLWNAILQRYRYTILLSDNAFSCMLHATEQKHNYECRIG